MALVILELGLLFFLAHVFAWLFQRTKIPDVLLLIILGMLIGPVFGAVGKADFGKAGGVMTNITLVVILFESGLSLDMKALREGLTATTKLTLVSFLASIAIVAPIGVYLMGMSWAAGILMGVILGGTSSAVVIPLVAGLGLAPAAGTVLVLESAITDVLCIVGAVAGISTAAGGGEVAIGPIIGGTLASLTFATALGLAGSVGWLAVLNRVRNFPNTILSTVAAVFIVFGLSEFLGFSGAIAALAFGVGLASHRELGFDRLKLFAQDGVPPITPTERQFFAELVFLLKTFFFVYLAISLRFGGWASAGYAALIVGLIYTVRLVITRFTTPTTTSWKDAAFTSIMVPKGLAAAVLAGLPLERGVPEGAAIQDTVYMVVLFSITVTAVLAPLIERGALNFVYRPVFKGFAERPEPSAPKA